MRPLIKESPIASIGPGVSPIQAIASLLPLRTQPSANSRVLQALLVGINPATFVDGRAQGVLLRQPGTGGYSLNFPNTGQNIVFAPQLAVQLLSNGESSALLQFRALGQTPEGHLLAEAVRTDSQAAETRGTNVQTPLPQISQTAQLVGALTRLAPGAAVAWLSSVSQWAIPAPSGAQPASPDIQAALLAQLKGVLPSLGVGYERALANVVQGQTAAGLEPVGPDLSLALPQAGEPSSGAEGVVADGHLPQTVPAEKAASGNQAPTVAPDTAPVGNDATVQPDDAAAEPGKVPTSASDPRAASVSTAGRAQAPSAQATTTFATSLQKPNAEIALPPDQALPTLPSRSSAIAAYLGVAPKVVLLGLPPVTAGGLPEGGLRIQLAAVAPTSFVNDQAEATVRAASANQSAELVFSTNGQSITLPATVATALLADRSLSARLQLNVISRNADGSVVVSASRLPDAGRDEISGRTPFSIAKGTDAALPGGTNRAALTQYAQNASSLLVSASRDTAIAATLASSDAHGAVGSSALALLSAQQLSASESGSVQWQGTIWPGASASIEIGHWPKNDEQPNADKDEFRKWLPADAAPLAWINMNLSPQSLGPLQLRAVHLESGETWARLSVTNADSYALINQWQARMEDMLTQSRVHLDLQFSTSHLLPPGAP